jgi:hypothetical protein
MNTPATADPSLVHVSYDTCIGFLQRVDASSHNIVPPMPAATAAALPAAAVAALHLSTPYMQLPETDPDIPWYCCLHPNPQWASCLVPEELHDMNTPATTDPSLAHVSYDSCIGFKPADPAAAAAEGADERHTQNVAHFSAVINAAANGIASEGSRQVLAWLAKQKPEGLLTGLTVPRDLRDLAPDYGE